MPRKVPKSRPVRLKAAGYGISTETGEERFFLVIQHGEGKAAVEATFDFCHTDAVRMSGTLDQYMAWKIDPDSKRG